MCGPQQPTYCRLIILDLEANRHLPGPYTPLLCVRHIAMYDLTRIITLLFLTLSQEMDTTGLPEGEETKRKLRHKVNRCLVLVPMTPAPAETELEQTPSGWPPDHTSQTGQAQFLQG